MSGENLTPKTQTEGNTPSNKVYGSYKVSEFTHGKDGYKIVDEPPEIAERKRKKD